MQGLLAYACRAILPPSCRPPCLLLCVNLPPAVGMEPLVADGLFLTTVCCAGTRAAAGEGQVTSLVSQMEDTNTRLDATAARLSSLESTAAETQQQLLDQRQALAAATALATAVVERGAATDHGSDGSAGSSSSSKGSAVALRASSASNAQQALLTECLTKQLAELKQQFWGLSATVAAMSSARRVASTLARKQGQESQSVKSEDLDAAPCPAAGEIRGCGAVLLASCCNLTPKLSCDYSVHCAGVQLVEIGTRGMGQGTTGHCNNHTSSQGIFRYDP
jgi:hypothetical protein